jgi:rod shape determining protein RodA
MTRFPAWLVILAAALLISVIGISCIYASTAHKEGKLWQDIYKRQIMWVIVGTVLFLLLSRIDYHRILDAAVPLYALTVLLLFAIFALGIVRLGAQRWLKFGWFNFQPSELAKLVMVIILARYFSSKSLAQLSVRVGNLGFVRGFLLPFFYTMIPAGLVIEQPDLGSGLIVVFIFLSMIYLAGVKLRYLVSFLGLCMVSVPVMWHYLREYQKTRLMVFMNPSMDPLGAGYTIIQAKIAIGSGGFFGKGWLSGTQSQLHFLPESHTDFIFSAFAEQWGFFGCALLLGLYAVLVWQGMVIASRTGDHFAKFMAWGVSLMLGIQVFINVAMNMGLAPVVGVPLPMMSYGGSSVMITFAALGILAGISRRRSAY